MFTNPYTARSSPGGGACAVPCAPPPGCLQHPEHDSGRKTRVPDKTAQIRIRSMKRLLHHGKLIILTMALASGGLAGSVAATQVAHAATHPAAAMSARTQPASQYHPPDPC